MRKLNQWKSDTLIMNLKEIIILYTFIVYRKLSKLVAVFILFVVIPLEFIFAILLGLYALISFLFFLAVEFPELFHNFYVQVVIDLVYCGIAMKYIMGYIEEADKDRNEDPATADPYAPLTLGLYLRAFGVLCTRILIELILFRV